mgnify:CR=1 FL=1
MENDGGAVATPRSINKRGGDVAQKRDEPNWKRIKAEYVRGGISQQKLADKYSVPIRTIKEHARKEKWSELRKEACTKAAQKMVQKTADIQADTVAKMLQMQSEAALTIYGKLMATLKTFPDGVGTKNVRETVEIKKLRVNDEEREFPLHKTFTNDLEAIVRSMASLAKLYGIDAASQVARERFDLQKKLSGGDCDVAEINENIVSLAELINHPLPNQSIEEIEASLEGGENG